MGEFDELPRDIDVCDDKRTAAIHEAGHVVVAAIRDGKMAGAFIKRSETGDPQNKSLWNGGVRAYDNASPAMKLAGAVAVVLDEQPSIDAKSCLEEIVRRREELLSQSDLRGLPSDYGHQLKAVGDALTTLREHREFFQWVVDELLNDDGNRVTDGMVAAYLESRKP